MASIERRMLKAWSARGSRLVRWSGRSILEVVVWRKGREWPAQRVLALFSALFIGSVGRAVFHR